MSTVEKTPEAEQLVFNAGDSTPIVIESADGKVLSFHLEKFPEASFVAWTGEPAKTDPSRVAEIIRLIASQHSVAGDDYLERLERMLVEARFKQYREQFTALVAKMRDSAPVLGVTSAGSVAVHAHKQNTLLPTYPILRAGEFAGKIGVRGNASRKLSQMVRDKKLFSVTEGEQMCYPQFQIDPDTNAPYAVLQDVLPILSSAGVTDWGAYYWFTDVDPELELSAADALGKAEYHKNILGWAVSTRSAKQGR